MVRVCVCGAGSSSHDAAVTMSTRGSSTTTEERGGTMMENRSWRDLEERLTTLLSRNGPRFSARTGHHSPSALIPLYAGLH